MAVYKKDQGIYARRTALWLLVLLLLWGAFRLYVWFSGFAALKASNMGEIPLTDVKLNWAFAIAAIIFAAAVFGCAKLLNRPKLADLMIDTEQEMKKVTWPTFNDAVNSSVIVIVTVIIFAVFLSVANTLYELVFDAMFL
ncbi:MAG: preprotein translocase subunit SecE [Planctomycetota bacterium]